MDLLRQYAEDCRAHLEPVSVISDLLGWDFLIVSKLRNLVPGRYHGPRAVPEVRQLPGQHVLLLAARGDELSRPGNADPGQERADAEVRDVSE